VKHQKMDCLMRDQIINIAPFIKCLQMQFLKTYFWPSLTTMRLSWGQWMVRKQKLFRTEFKTFCSIIPNYSIGKQNKNKLSDFLLWDQMTVVLPKNWNSKFDFLIFIFDHFQQQYDEVKINNLYKTTKCFRSPIKCIMFNNTGWFNR